MKSKMENFLAFVALKTKEERDDMNSCKEEIYAENVKIFQTMLFGVSFIFWISFFTSYIYNFFELIGTPDLRWVNFVVASVSMTGFIIVILFRPKNIIRMMYIMNLIAVGYAFYSSAIITPEQVNVVFLVVLFMVAVLYIDYGMRVHFFMTFITILYLISISFFKPQDIFYTEVMNSIIVLFILFIIGTIMRMDRIEVFVGRSTLRNYAYKDQLTAVSNRRKLFEDLAEFEDEESKERITAITLLDVDNFKLYNDTYGHGKGDECLKKVGEVLNDFENRYKLKCYRYGGEEFAIIFIDTDDKSVALKINELLNSIRDLKIEHKMSNHNVVTISAGTADIIPQGETRFEFVLSIADKALYKAKAGGRNRAEFIDFSLNVSHVRSDTVRHREDELKNIL